MATSLGAFYFLVLLLCASAAKAANFTAGNILALRVSSGSAALSSTATAILLEELNSSTGALAQPTIAVTVCTLSGTSTLQGQLSESPDGANSAFACFAATAGSANPTTRSTVQRGAVILNSDATLSGFAGFGSAYQSPARAVFSAVVASSIGNFYVGGDGGNVRGLSYSVGAGQTTTAVNTILSRKATVYDSTLFVAGPLGPGPGVHQVGLAGSPPTSSASETRITTDTTTSTVYGSGASVASYVFESSSILWICDDGAASTQGVWIFEKNSVTSLYEPTSAASRVWGADVCSDIALRGVIFFVGGNTAGNAIYRMSAAPPYVATALTTASAPGDAYRGIAVVPIPASITSTRSPSQTLTRSSTVTQARSVPLPPSSVSETNTRSGTQTKSTSQSSSTSQSASVSRSTSPSESGSQSVTNSGSASLAVVSSSPNYLKSASQRATPAASTSQARTPSQGATPSETPSVGASLSQTKSPSLSSSDSSSQLTSASQHATPSTTTQTTTRSQCTTLTPSPSQSVTTGLTPTATPSQAKTPSSTASETATQAMSPSASRSQRQTPSQTPSQSRSQDKTCSQAETRPITLSQSSSASSSASPSASTSGSGSASGSASILSPSSLSTLSPSSSPSHSRWATLTRASASRSFAVTLSASRTAVLVSSSVTATRSMAPFRTASSSRSKGPFASALGSVSASVSSSSTSTVSPSAAPISGALGGSDGSSGSIDSAVLGSTVGGVLFLLTCIAALTYAFVLRPSRRKRLRTLKSAKANLQGRDRARSHHSRRPSDNAPVNTAAVSIGLTRETVMQSDDVTDKLGASLTAAGSSRLQAAPSLATDPALVQRTLIESFGSPKSNSARQAAAVVTFFSEATQMPGVVCHAAPAQTSQRHARFDLRTSGSPAAVAVASLFGEIQTTQFPGKLSRAMPAWTSRVEPQLGGGRNEGLPLFFRRVSDPGAIAASLDTPQPRCLDGQQRRMSAPGRGVMPVARTLVEPPRTGRQAGGLAEMSRPRRKSSLSVVASQLLAEAHVEKSKR